MPIRILIADDHPIVREGLAAILSTQPDFEVVAAAADGEEALALVRSLDPDVLLLDLEMPRLDGVGVLKRLATEKLQIRAIVFTVFDTDERIVAAVEAGAQGYLLKGAPREEIFAAVRVVSDGGSLLQPLVASRLLKHMSGRAAAPPLDPLTPRELEVLEALALGRTNREIATELEISERTVKFHVSSILDKLGAGNRTEAVSLARRQGLVKGGG
jgi:two-component system, NarL family, response regulator LiaR